jgi:hypothetical protein
VTVAVLGNDTDVDGGTLGITEFSQPAVGTGTTALSKDRKGVQYTPARNFTGDATFGYTISDGRGGTAAGDVTVTVK